MGKQSEINQFAQHLKSTLDEFFVHQADWRVAVQELEDRYLITAVQEGDMPSPEDVPEGVRQLVIWTFSENGRVAYIYLRKPLDFSAFVAELISGNLFGQGLSLSNQRHQKPVVENILEDG